METEKLRCAILGATGAIGQHFVIGLADHPWMEISGLYASEASAGRKYREACGWHLETEMPQKVGSMQVMDIAAIDGTLDDHDIVFSALPAKDGKGNHVAKKYEAMCAVSKLVLSTASSFRYENDVPIILLEVNEDHLQVARAQQKNRSWEGLVLPGPNCTTVALVVALQPIQYSILNPFRIKDVVVFSEQAISGAGRDLRAIDITDNVIPHIAHEEQKVMKETRKILGRLRDGTIENANFTVSPTCTRGQHIDGHMLAVYVETERQCSPEDYRNAVALFNLRFREKYGHLPSAPAESIVLRKEENRPQPRLDLNVNGGMSTVIGRVRNDERGRLLFLALSHNRQKGGAKDRILLAEHLIDRKFIRRGQPIRLS